jgi:uncharacterized Zn-binding protein involved in type VI secretion
MDITAAAIGDLTSHGTPLSPGPGMQNVLVGGRPIWRVHVDFHSCPISDPKPHVGGSVVIGRKRIMAGNFLVAFKGDTIIEAGTVNMILP